MRVYKRNFEQTSSNQTYNVILQNLYSINQNDSVNSLLLTL